MQLMLFHLLGTTVGVFDGGQRKSILVHNFRAPFFFLAKIFLSLDLFHRYQITDNLIHASVSMATKHAYPIDQIYIYIYIYELKTYQMVMTPGDTFQKCV